MRIHKNHLPTGLRAIALAALVAVTACFSPLGGDGEGTITINLGGNGRAAAWPPDNAGIFADLEHRVTLKGPTGTQSHIIKDSGTANFVVAKGFWNVEVEALFGSYRYAVGSGGAEVKGGVTSPCAVTMRQAESNAAYLAVSNKDEWEEARTEISQSTGVNSRDYVIFVTNDIEIDPSSSYTISNDFTGTVTICGKKTLSPSNNGNLLNIAADQTFIVYDTKLKGRTSNNSPVVNVDGGTFFMRGSSSVTENTNSGGNGGGVSVVNGTFTMEGNASVSGNSGGGVNVSTSDHSNFTMKDNASVSGNISVSNGGGVSVVNVASGSSCEFIMQGNSSVYGNKTTGLAGNGGGVHISSVSTGSIEFTMQDSSSVYDNESAIFTKTVRHKDDELRRFGSILNQKTFRKDRILTEIQAAGILPETLDAVSGRGGLLKPIESGTYPVNEAMLADLQTASAAIHASALGAIIAAELAGPLSIPAYVVDPVVVDEMDRKAKLTGIPGIERSSVFHALNQKAIARRVAEKIGKPYENARFVIAHLGGGITVGAHRYGRVIDVNDGLSGEGPFTPERSGGVPAIPLINMCFSGEYTKEELLEKIHGRGGMRGYLGTNDEVAVQKMINDGDEFAALVLDSMAYQVSKEIGAMTAVLEGRVDAIALTGGLAHSNRFTSAIKQRVDRLAPLYVFPGEDEMLALMGGALRVLRGEEAVAVYE
jgi:butyrate kinase